MYDIPQGDLVATLSECKDEHELFHVLFFLRQTLKEFELDLSLDQITAFLQFAETTLDGASGRVETELE